jgi:imidazolonepropionase-like amidohydrolase
LKAGRIVDVAAGKVLTGHCITIAGEKIAAVEPCKAQPDSIRTIDWSTYTVLPGLMDLHTHLADAGQSADLALPLKTSPAATALIGAKNARDTLMAGFTTVRDVGTYRGLTDVALKDAINMPAACRGRACLSPVAISPTGRRR